MAEQPVLIMVSTRGRDDAEQLGEALVVARLAACCNVVPSVASFYYWDDQLQREHEALLLIKTLESKADVVQEFVRAHHDYDLLEMIRLPIAGGHSPYLNWLEKQVTQPRP